MRLTRRGAIWGGLAAVGALGVAAATPFLTRRFEDEVLRTIRVNFGRRIAKSEAAREFATDLALLLGTAEPDSVIGQQLPWLMLSPVREHARIAREDLAGRVVLAFIDSTTAVRAHETGQEPAYLGLPEPGVACLNSLGANFL